MKTFLRTVSVSVCLVLITVLCISGDSDEQGEKNRRSRR